MGLFSGSIGRKQADPFAFAYPTTTEPPPAMSRSGALPASFATSVEALAVSDDAPPPGLMSASSRTIPDARPSSPFAQPPPPPPKHEQPPTSSANHSNRQVNGRANRAAAAAAAPLRSAQLAVPSSTPLPNGPFQPAHHPNGRSHSDSALPNRSSLRPLSSSSPARQPPMPASKSLTKARPNSFLGFLGGSGHASRTSVLSAASTVTASQGKKSKQKAHAVVPLGSAPSRKGPSRVVAVVGSVRKGIGRMIVEELVRNKTIVVALTDVHDGQFGKELEALALSPSLFHAFPVPALFGPAFVPQPAAVNGGEYFANGGSTPNLSVGSSTPSLNAAGVPTPPNLGSTTSFGSAGKKSSRFSKASSSRAPDLSASTPSSSSTDPTTGGKLSAAAKAYNERHACLVELANIFKSYRVDTVLAIFEPRDRHASPSHRKPPSSPPTATADPAISIPAPTEPDPLPALTAGQERARIEEMERVCLQAAIECGAGRFASCAWTPSLFRTPLSVVPSTPPDHVRRAPLGATVFRWGVLMNELAAGVAPNEVGDTALGKWLDPPPKRSGRFVVDFGKSTAYIPRVEGKGKTTDGVSLTLAEDVARFVALACKMKAEWEWSTGTMVGERIRGGWEEVIDMLDVTCRYNFKREYVSAPPEPSPNSSSDYLSANPNGAFRSGSPSSNSSDDSPDGGGLTIPSSRRQRDRSPADMDDVLRGILAIEGLDASSVRLAEFLRVWFSPRNHHRPPPPPTGGPLSPPVHGPRAVRHSSSAEGLNGVNGGSAPRHHGQRTMSGDSSRSGGGGRGPPPARSAGTATGGGRTRSGPMMAR